VEDIPIFYQPIKYRQLPVPSLVTRISASTMPSIVLFSPANMPIGRISEVQSALETSGAYFEVILRLVYAGRSVGQA